MQILGDPADPRLDDIGGDLTPEWGLHIADAQIAMGDLVANLHAQIDTYLGSSSSARIERDELR